MKPITQAQLDMLPAKSKKDPRVVELYQQHDYATAYALHTDLRVAEQGYKGAIGNDQDWELEGAKQAAFLFEEAQLLRAGTNQSLRFLEVGCGTGRLARHIVPRVRSYWGVDLSEGALTAARELSITEGWGRYSPVFSTYYPRQPVDMAFAFSVFIHCPAELMARTMQDVALCLVPGGSFYFSFVPEKQDLRTGLKQFRHTKAAYKAAVQGAGLVWGGGVPSWPGPQGMAHVYKPNSNPST